MNVAVAYCYPLVQKQRYFPLARRFADTWRRFPGHDLCLIFNGGAIQSPDLAPFSGISYHSLFHDNLGWDVGAFQAAAETIPCDLLICLGAPVHFHQPAWIERMVDAYVDHGPALYGCWGYHYPTSHIRTTAFWLPPQLLSAYPDQVISTRASRYAFEHGKDSLAAFTRKCGMETYMVTRTGCYPESEWKDHVPGVEDSLLLDQHIHL